MRTQKSIAAGKVARGKRQRFENRQRREMQRRRRDIAVIVISALTALVIGIVGSRIRDDFEVRSAKAIVNEDVLSYEPLIKKYADQYGVSAYVPVIEAMMQQESSGQGTDVMQSSECMYNTEYAQVPGGIQSAEYSIDVGIRYFAHCLELAECHGPHDRSRLMLALQGYNFGHNYIDWAVKRDGSYTEEGAQAFSNMMKEHMGWSVYGDTEYPQHVLRYYQ